MTPVVSPASEVTQHESDTDTLMRLALFSKILSAAGIGVSEMEEILYNSRIRHAFTIDLKDSADRNLGRIPRAELNTAAIKHEAIEQMVEALFGKLYRSIGRPGAHNALAHALWGDGSLEKVVSALSTPRMRSLAIYAYGLDGRFLDRDMLLHAFDCSSSQLDSLKRELDRELRTLIMRTYDKDTHVPIETLSTNQRLITVLKRARINTIADLLDCTEDDLLGVTNFGASYLSEINAALAERDLSLKA